MRCSACGLIVEWSFVCEYVDFLGRKWEVYECSNCGEMHQYAVG